MSAGSVRVLLEDDLDLILEWRNDPRVREHMFNQGVIEASAHRRWFDEVQKNSLAHIFVYEIHGKPCGFFRLDEHSDGQRSGVWGFYTAPDAPRGTGRQLGTAAIEHAFGPLDWHRLAGWTLASNERSIRMHVALGFRQEGLMREYHRIGDTFVDVCCFGLLRSEWPITKE
jgi:UDP-4-amino-4,6-dideoxy-N-acetyl-beta-L-altrosamine N-acetyltransferase